MFPCWSCYQELKYQVLFLLPVLSNQLHLHLAYLVLHLLLLCLLKLSNNWIQYVELEVHKRTW